jgi:hypothetical protein
MIRVLVLAGCGLLAAGTIAAQNPPSPADSAWNRGDREGARRAYATEVAQRPDNSRAVFRLASLTANRRDALALHRRYVALEPQDGWGWMALGDHLARMGETDEALAMYDRAAALLPAERSVPLGRARIQAGAGRHAVAAATIEAWTLTHPDDGSAWMEAGRAWMRAARPRRAATAYARAQAAGEAGATAQLRRARLAAAPAIEPMIGRASDSDGNHTTRIGGTADLQVAGGTRFGIVGVRDEVSNDITGRRMHEGAGRLTFRPDGNTRLTVRAGAVRLDPSPVDGAWSTASVDVRFRWNTPSRLGAELRGQRLPLGATPELVDNRAVRTEGGVRIGLPIGPVVVRAGARLGSISSIVDDNSRILVDGMVALPVSDVMEISVQYHRVHYDHPTTAGYFAPDHVETAEGGVSTEFALGPIAIGLDAAAGAQRIEAFAGEMGPWRLSLRGWGSAEIPVAPQAALRFEVEAYDAPFAVTGVAVTDHWKYLFVSAGLRVSLGR